MCKAYDAIKKRLMKMSEKEVFDIALALRDKYDDDDADLVFSVCLDVLEEKLDEKKFIELVEKHLSI